MNDRFERRRRRGAVIVMSALLMVVMVGMVAFALDIGYIVLVRTELQVAADAAAMASAARLGGDEKEIRRLATGYAALHIAGGKPVQLSDSDIELGIWDQASRHFVATSEQGNAIRITARRHQDGTGEAPLFFARIFGRKSFAMDASAVAVANPRDIAFVVDQSGSMNDDTDPAWATTAINDKFGQQGYPGIGSELMQNLYDDFGFGPYPGPVAYIGEPLGVSKNRYAYAELTQDGGPLTASALPHRYRIDSRDSEIVRKRKAYSAIIDFQIAKLMPAARPTPDSRTNYAYWEKYLDYIIDSERIGSRPKKKSSGQNKKKKTSKPKNSTPQPAKPKPTIGRVPAARADFLAHWNLQEPAVPAAGSGRAGRLELVMASPVAWQSPLLPALIFGGVDKSQYRGWLPPQQDGDRIDRFNNPNRETFPEVSSSTPRGYRNWIGYVTYVNFMTDHGRDLKPEGKTYTPLSRHSPDCPYHTESTPAGSFSFPPREQPMHAVRRSLIAAMAVVQERNQVIPDKSQRDWVSVIGFDTLTSGGPVVEQPLTGDYQSAMQACTQLQAAGDKGASTATEAGLALAREHLRGQNEGGSGRSGTQKVVVLLTDGVPNLYISSDAKIDQYIKENPSPDYQGGGYYWYDAALMQASSIHADNWMMFPVGIGLGTDHDFMDRMARLGGTSNDSGQSPRGSGNPAEYEQRLTEIFEEIINTPSVRLVQ